MNILGFNPSHHGSVCLLQDGEIKYFLQEDRLTRRKNDDLPFKVFIEILQNYRIDYIALGPPFSSYTHFFSKLATHFTPSSYNIKTYDYSFKNHHTTHAAHAFYNSGFKKSAVLVIDGIGSSIDKLGVETESIFLFEYPSKIKLFYKRILNFDNIFSKKTKNYYISTNLSLARSYRGITEILGFKQNEEGKTMGLSSYGKLNSKIPNFFTLWDADPNIISHKKDNHSLNLNLKDYPNFNLKNKSYKWHYDESKTTDLEKDIAWRIQNDTQKIVGNYVEKIVKETGYTKICCAGGYFLNCVSNYYLKKRFPNVEFYFEPIANDAGTAIGAAKLLWHNLTQDNTIRPFKSLYLGPQYSKEKLLEGIKKYVGK